MISKIVLTSKSFWKFYDFSFVILYKYFLLWLSTNFDFLAKILKLGSYPPLPSLFSTTQLVDVRTFFVFSPPLYSEHVYEGTAYITNCKTKDWSLTGPQYVKIHLHRLLTHNVVSRCESTVMRWIISLKTHVKVFRMFFNIHSALQVSQRFVHTVTSSLEHATTDELSSLLLRYSTTGTRGVIL